MVGTMLRQYRVTSHLGKGGMGEVWKARDTILDRDVALKLLPSDGADQAVRKERFFREARAASALNHPNIITIYEINSDQGVDFIAMEHVRGRTLAAILRDGPLTIEQAVRYALQIAEAVGRAHSAGIVHRDLKPGNIMLTDDDDLVKVLDFGLAKLVQVASNESELPSELATQMVLTQAGSTSGTAGYMSPEQAIGDVTDARSDVFSFGVILYEMFTRTLPFAAKNRLDGLRELHFGNPAPLESLRSDAPPAIVAIVSRTLAKRPTERFANLTQVATALRLALSGHSNPTAPAAPSTLGFDRPSIPRAPMSQRATLIAVSIVVIAGAMGTVVWRSRAPVPPMATADPSPQLNQSAGVSELTHEAARLMGRQDKDGNFWIVGRIDDVLNVSGHRIGTAEIESALVSHPAVAEAAAVGRPDELKGQALVVFVTLKASHTASDELKEALRVHVGKEIGSLAKPDTIRFAAGLPKTRSGKIMRRLLKELATSGSIKGDTTTLEDFSVISALQTEE